MNNSLVKISTMILFINSIIFILSSKSMFFLWACMELNLLLVIPLLKKFSKNNMNSMLTYFMIQSLSSSIFLFFMICSNLYIINSMFCSIMIFSSMWVKMGLFPFMSWFFQITQNLDWFMWFLMNTSQKIIPLWILMNFIYSYSNLSSLILLNNIYSSIEIWAQSSLRWMINSSSLNHFGWMITSMLSENSIWEIYFLFYFLSSYMLYKFLTKNNWNTMFNTIFTSHSINSWMFSLIMLNFLSIPPFFTFVPKLLILIQSKSFMMISILALNNILLATLYFFYCMNMKSKIIKNKIIKTKQDFMLINLFMVFMLINTLYIMLLM